MGEEHFSHAPISRNKFELAKHSYMCYKHVGMLSTITDSSLDFLKENVKKKHSSNSLSSVPLCLVHMNSDFVTQFSVSKNSVAECELFDESAQTDLKSKERCKIKVKKHFSPYIVKNAIRDKSKCHPICIPTILEVNDNILMPQDSGNKSNPNSPVKSQTCLTTEGCSIFRSRSLDDLEISKLNLKEDGSESASHGEIETVSQRISRLNVN